MKIISLKTENVKRIRAVEIAPDGNVVVIGGSNGQGKSSVLDSIMYALGGAGVLPPKPVRDGEDEATITVDLGEIVATRTITSEGKSSIKLVGADGGRFAGPQTILDSLVGKLSFDPLSFSRMEPRKQVETLKALVGLDFSTLDRKRAAKEEDRLLVGREIKQMKGQLAGLPKHPDAPTEEITVADLTEKLAQARGVNQMNAQKRASAAGAAKVVGDWKARIAEIEQELAEARKSLLESEAFAKIEAAKAATVSDVNESAILEQMTGAELVNRKVRENRDRLRVAQALDQKEAAYQSLTSELDGIDGEKTRQLEAAKFPVPSLSFDESGVSVAGVPFQQASAAEQLRVSIAMAAALNPKLRVMLIRDASLLDAQSMAVVSEMAEERDYQIWLERVSSDEPSAVVIEDGAVLRRNPSKRIPVGAQ